MEYVTENKFCLSINLAFLCKKQQVTLDEWQLFLAMKPLGFQYHGIELKQREYLTGLSGDSRSLLKQAVTVLKGQIREADVDVDSDEVWGNNMVIEVDDYYLPYTTAYKNTHNTRFAIATKVDGERQLFDSEFREVSLIDLTHIKKVWKVNFINGIDMKINELLLKAYDTSWEGKELYVSSVHQFIETLNEPEDSWDTSVYEKLFVNVNRGAGPSGIRRFLFTSLKTLIEDSKYISENIDKKLSLLKTVSEEWELIGNLFFKMSVGPDRDLLIRLNNRIKEVGEKEALLFQ